jgi:hypothetical protein
MFLALLYYSLTVVREDKEFIKKATTLWCVVVFSL